MTSSALGGRPSSFGDGLEWSETWLRFYFAKRNLNFWVWICWNENIPSIFCFEKAKWRIYNLFVFWFFSHVFFFLSLFHLCIFLYIMRSFFVLELFWRTMILKNKCVLCGSRQRSVKISRGGIQVCSKILMNHKNVLRLNSCVYWLIEVGYQSYVRYCVVFAYVRIILL